MRNREAFLTLIEELKGDFSEIERLAGHNRRAWERVEGGSVDVLDYGALAYTIHTLYGVLENYFLRISKFFENNLPSQGWHKALVERMALDIPGVRPPLMTSREWKQDVLTVLRFRHKFRHLYGEDLDPAQTAAVQGALFRLLEGFPEIHETYCEKLRALAEAV